MGTTLIALFLLLYPETQENFAVRNFREEVIGLCKLYDIYDEREIYSYPGIAYIPDWPDMQLETATKDSMNTLSDRFTTALTFPPISETKRFIGLEEVKRMINFGEEYKLHITKRLELDVLNKVHLEIILEECNMLIEMYKYLGYAVNDNYYPYFRRESLDTFRTLLGANRFYSGNLLPVVPVWRIPEQ